MWEYEFRVFFVFFLTFLLLFQYQNDNNLLYYKKFGSTNEFSPIVDDWIGDFRIVHNVGSVFYLQTTYNSPKGRIVKIDINNIKGTQEIFNHRANMCSLAAQGKWSKELEAK